MKTTQAVMLLACAHHAPEVLRILDELRIGDWTVLPAVQARRLGYLQDVRGRHPDTCYTIYGFGEREVVAQVLAQLEHARTEGHLCPECAAYTWNVNRVLPARVALDPVCHEVVDCNTAPSADYNDTTYYFCSDENRDAFLQQPEVYLKRCREQHIGRRDIASNTVSLSF